ncbi:MAG: hypothetical protein J6Z00_02100 [Clostridia bacterium]|nr:hypothetical protein [Clostridia bacterium]
MRFFEKLKNILTRFKTRLPSLALSRKVVRRTQMGLRSLACLLVLTLLCVSHIGLPVTTTHNPVPSKTQTPAEQTEQYGEVQLEVTPKGGEDQTVYLSGWMPKETTATVETVTEEYAGDDPKVDVTSDTIGAQVVSAYDITLYDGKTEYQPNALYPVEVTIEDEQFAEKETLRVWHITSDGTPEKVACSRVNATSLSFKAKGFSVYVITELKAVYQAETASALADLISQHGEEGFYIYYSTSKKYWSNSATVNNTGAINVVTGLTTAGVWYFDKVGDYYKIYQLVETSPGNFTPYYVHNTTDVNIELSTTDADLFEISAVSGGAFYFKKANESLWLQYSGSGKGIRYYGSNSNATNCKMYLEYSDTATTPDDYLELDGVTTGLMNYSSGTFGNALMADATTNALTMRTMTVRRQTGVENLYVAEDVDITEWTFHWVSENNYTISTEVGGVTQYLKMTSSALQLVSQNQATTFTIRHDSNNHIQISSGSKSINFNGSKFVPANTTTNSNQWLYLAEKANLTSTDYISYTAQKVSVATVPDQTTVIVYTRVWNDTNKCYDFYAIDYDGTLYPCYEHGDNIMWIGNQINTLLWTFTEYHWEDGSPNNYYELYNQYSHTYFAPQIQDGQVLSDHTIGINMPERAYGEYYSTIIAWDDPYYVYASLDADVANGQLVSCAKGDGVDFYFAILEQPSNSLTEVATVDNTQYGIVMKMIDFPVQPDTSTGLSHQNDFLGTNANSTFTATPGLLSTNLAANGYPTAVRTGNDLAELYAGAATVNHLFLQSTYEASGYYEFDSCQNYATLMQSDGSVGTNFTVYEELGTSDNLDRSSLKHGQFFPYDSISAGKFAVKNSQNLYTALAQYTNPSIGLLPDSDPRKYEKLMLINSTDGKPNYYNGMEMTASFTQTADGKDAWGHDVIFEFAGDDDFWFYADGELVIDLGGIHSALQGSVNFSTGDVVVEGVHKTLRQVFQSNYEARNPSATAQQVQEYLDGFFANGGTIFKPYTTHKMTVFYMERGGGASNLHMRFNLSNVSPGNIMLMKNVTGSDDMDFNLVEFPYQIWYKLKNDNTEHLLTNVANVEKVTYQSSTQHINNVASYTPPNTNVSYSSVYMINPNRATEVHFPADTTEYRILECGINEEVYDQVLINNQAILGQTLGTSNRGTYDSGWISLNTQTNVVFENHVEPSSLRTFSVQKVVRDNNGTVLDQSQDKSTFSFRLYLSNGSDDTLVAANMVKYYVTDEDGYICSWDASSGRLVPTEYTSYESLTAVQKAAVTFETSMYGAISRIPVGYSVNVPNLPVGTKFQLIERPTEIPDGYEWVSYEREVGTYHAEDGDTLNSGWVRANESPKMYVNNRRGWALDVSKVWSDSHYTEGHDPVYIAVYADGTLVPDTVRQLTEDDEEIKYFFANLLPGKTFADYQVFEVVLDNPTLDGDGNLVSYDGVDQVLHEGDLTTIYAMAGNPATRQPFSYCVEYEQGTPVSTDLPNSSLNNIRHDTITNTRTGGVVITLYDMDTDVPLAGGTFTLVQGNISIGTFTSDSHGRITILYEFDRNTNYTLTQTNAPAGYIGLPNAVTFSIGSDDTVTTSGNTSEWQDGYKSDVVSDRLIAYVDVYNKPYTFTAYAVDSETGDPLIGAHYALYRTVSGLGGQMKDSQPMAGYTDLVTGADGIIPRINGNLEPGKYYLTMTTPPTDHLLFNEDIVFTLSDNGTVVINSAGHSGYLTEEGVTSSDYILEIPIDPVPQEATLTISQAILGNMGDKTKAFTYTLTVAGAQVGDSYVWSKNGVPQQTNLTSGGTFTLTNDDVVCILVPKNVNITITESNESYTSAFKLGTASAQQVNTKTFVLTSDTTLAISNTLQGVIPLGVEDSITPYVLGMLVFLILGIWLFVKAKKSRLAAQRPYEG